MIPLMNIFRETKKLLASKSY